ncbi:MXAN_6640 family putative metalloprotease [Nocardioides sp. Arc9.136]|uniref:MXAN_6640 family putative metalloprotease n=1 Tax=Nocardioides sp. Arc9.136 TaxID=2996826 RepID=UPI002665AECE|nr:MXAN_6640 family putative metalloprotease [Nocardioides sp. Arc9.136]WKN47089.1 hypothetical protein OSR43_13685 [Nocardioides sp. Arc9.136]
MLPRLHARIVAAVLALGVVVVLLSAAPVLARADRPAGPAGRLPGDPAARVALAAARGALAGDGREVTLALRDLALRRGGLVGREREEADRILARPTDGPLDPDGYGLLADPQRTCTVVCLHWVERGVDAVPTADADADGLPDHVEQALAVLTRVHRTYVRAGYRAPKADGALGGDRRPDVYLVDIGDQAVYGYCTTDELLRPGGPYDAWAYCVLDNDYDPAQFPQGTPLGNLRVTAAHEYFHAVQYGYDAAEDPWLLEATATWAEDELYDAVDDNLQYLRRSPLSQPAVPVDAGGFTSYGGWVLFRHLTERFRTAGGGLPTFVRDVWRQADSRRGAPDRWSVQAIGRVLQQRGTTLRGAFARFAAANRHPRATYDEGRANDYPHAPLADRAVLGAGRTTGWGSMRLDHLTSGTVRLSPRAGLRGAWRVRLQLDLPPPAAGAAAVVTTKVRGRPATTRLVRTDRRGRAALRAPLGAATWVEVTLANGSGRYRCWQATDLACMGTPVDDGAVFRWRATATR